MKRSASLTALLLLGWLLVCPLASAGVFAACHEGEEAMDCCLPHEGSGPQQSAKTVTAGALPLALAALGEPLASQPPYVIRTIEPTRSTSGPRRHSLLSVFLV